MKTEPFPEKGKGGGGLDPWLIEMHANIEEKTILKGCSIIKTDHRGVQLVMEPTKGHTSQTWHEESAKCIVLPPPPTWICFLIVV